MSTELAVELDGQYRAMKEGAGVLERSSRAMFLVRGPDAAEFLQGQLTNDIEALEPGTGCYAALLDRKGHMQADMRVLRLSTGGLWLDTEADGGRSGRCAICEMYRIGREVEIEDATGEWALLSRDRARPRPSVRGGAARRRARPARVLASAASRASPSQPTSAST